MTDFISTRVKDVPPSGIRKFFDIASEMKDCISLGVGEPDFDTPGIFARVRSLRLSPAARTIRRIMDQQNCAKRY